MGIALRELQHCNTATHSDPEKKTQEIRKSWGKIREPQ